jgi:hypothetical protein
VKAVADSAVRRVLAWALLVTLQSCGGDLEAAREEGCRIGTDAGWEQGSDDGAACRCDYLNGPWGVPSDTAAFAQDAKDACRHVKDTRRTCTTDAADGYRECYAAAYIQGCCNAASLASGCDSTCD